MSRLAPGRHVPVRRVRLLSGQTVDLADGRSMTHLQFRRFASCPVCDLHLRSFVRRWAEVDTLLREIIVFHSPPDELAAYAGDIPFPLTADPEKKLYAAYGAEAGLSALLHPRAWLTILRAVVAALPRVMLRQRPMPPLFPKGGRYGLPADFLVSPAGVVIAAHYGEHSGDQWSVDTVLSLAARQGPTRASGAADRDRDLAATGQTTA